MLHKHVECSAVSGRLLFMCPAEGWDETWIKQSLQLQFVAPATGLANSVVCIGWASRRDAPYDARTLANNAVCLGLEGTVNFS